MHVTCECFDKQDQGITDVSRMVWSSYRKQVLVYRYRLLPRLFWPSNNLLLGILHQVFRLASEPRTVRIRTRCENLTLSKGATVRTNVNVGVKRVSNKNLCVLRWVDTQPTTYCLYSTIAFIPSRSY